MSQFGGGDVSKNPPWLSQGQILTGQVAVSQQSQVQPQIMTQMAAPAGMTMLQYQPAQMYQQPQMAQLQQPGLAMQTIGVVGTNQMTPATGMAPGIQQTTTLIQQPQVYQQMATVAYPTRTVLAPPFTNSPTTVGSVGTTSTSSTESPKQRVFTGRVTKIQDNFGFVDEEVFFQTSCCQGSVPQVGDRVLVDASYNANMPFKWNATRLQVLPMESDLKPLPPGSGRGRRFSNNPQSSFTDTPDTGIDDLDRRNRDIGGPRPNKRNRRNNFLRKRRREELRNERLREEKEKESPVEREKERQKTPPPRKTKPKSRKTVAAIKLVGQIPLDTPEADVLELRKRFTNMYIPSDFFGSTFKWVEVFPPHRALSLGRPCAFHVMHKDVDPVMENDAVLDPPDADYLFSAKVMLLSMPQLYEIYQKCCPLADGKEATAGAEEDKDYVHPTLLMNFLVGLKGKETMAIGGPWSPSLDGPNPEKDPKVLIKTAVRNCKALTGIDLSNCTQWYRFVEIYYHRAETVHKGKKLPARVETVVLYLPDVWSRLPTRMEWDGLHHNYKKKLDQLLLQKREAEGDDKDANAGAVPKKEPTHYAQLDPKNMKLTELREELEARNLPSKGMTAQLIARLIKVLKTEQDKEEQENASKTEAEKIAAVREKEKEEERKRKEEEEKKKQKERDVQLLEKRYILPEKSHILVHPSRVAKGGKFDCTVMSLCELLDYRQDDSKEHSFELFLFAELFNGMLMRDFGFRIYKSLVEAPEKTKEEKDEKDSKRDKKSDKDKKDEEKDNSEDADENKKKEQATRVTVDPYLLLAFVYFDQNLHGHLSDKSVEELLYSLGLHLSRAQIKKLVQKVESRGSVDYRKLTDKPKDEPKQNGIHTTEDLVTLAYGNKRLFPIFDESITPKKRSKTRTSVANTGMPNGSVKIKGSTVNIDKLHADFNTSVVSCRQSEKLLEKLQTEHERLNEQSRRTSAAITKLSTELHDFQERLNNTNTELTGVEGKTKWYFTLMNDIYEKLQPVFNQKTIKEEKMAEDMEDGCTQINAEEKMNVD